MNKDVHFKTVDAISNNTLENTDVRFTYVDKQLFNFKTKKFFTVDTIYLQGVTDETGVKIFDGISYTVYSKLFFAKEKSFVTATNDCFMGDSLMPIFHKLKHKKEEILKLPNRTYDYEFQVIDLDDKQPIPDADIVAKADNGQTWEVKTDPSGRAILTDFPYCGEATVIGSAYGYENDTIKGDTRYFYGDIDSNRTLILAPVKKMVKFIVKDKVTKQPIANAIAYLIIDGDTVQTVKTNVNGQGSIVGEGAFEDVHILKEITIIATKPFYESDSKTAKVDDFIQLDEEERTLYLNPKLTDVQFRNTDGSRGLSGVKNVITINGKRRSKPEYSNSSGYFMVSGVKESDVVSITATKSGYNSNNYTIRSKKFSNLMSGSSSKRDIPLTKKKPPPPPPPPPPPGPPPGPPPPNVVPCESPQESGGEGVTIRVHSVGNANTFEISWDMYNVPDRLIVYCGSGSNKRVLYDTKKPVSGSGKANLRCTKGYITVKVIGSDNTAWKYSMKCH